MEEETARRRDWENESMKEIMQGMKNGGNDRRVEMRVSGR